MLVSLHLDGRIKGWDSPSDVGRWRKRDRRTDIGVPARPSFFLSLNLANLITNFRLFSFLVETPWKIFMNYRFAI
jgi:hypothetical protein